MTLIKVCGITNIDDALACVELGADMLGFIFAESPRQVDPSAAKRIIAGVKEHGVPNELSQASALKIVAEMKMVKQILDIPHNDPPPTPLESLRRSRKPVNAPDPASVLARARPFTQPRPSRRIATVGVFTEERDDIVQVASECNLDFVQLHGNQSDEFAASIGPDRVIRVVRVKNESSIGSLADYQSACCYLLDTYKKGQPGGTGETFDWSLALLARSLLRKPIILSGGLNPANVFDAVRAVRPHAVDVSSGVESSPGKKDIAKVKEFIDHVREADGAA